MKQKATISEEKFNTGSHTSSSSRNVGAGYDDTGKGKYEKKSELDEKTVPNKKEQPAAGVTHKEEPNAGSGTFNQGAEQDTEMNEGVADGTSHPERVSKEKQNPKAKLKPKHLSE
jgi:hypothetical protein